MRPNTRLVVPLVAAALLFSTVRAQADYRPPEYGYQYGEIEQPRTMAMGGAARAMGTSTSSLTSNPANMVALPAYHFEGLFGVDTKAHRLQFGAAVMDSITSRLGLGLMASKTILGNSDDPYQRGDLDVRAALAYPLSDKVGLGVTAKYLRITQDGSGPLGQAGVSRGSSDGPNYLGFTFDAGLAFSLSEAIRLGLVGYNLTNTSSPLAPLMVGGGVGVKLGDATLEGNLVGVDKTTWGAWKTRLQTGFELLVAEHYPLRVGYQWDQGSKRHAVSAGAGYVDAAFAIDVALRQDVVAPDDGWGKAFRFTVGLRYFYDAAPSGGQGPGFGMSDQQL